MSIGLEELVIRRALRVPAPDGPAGDGSVAVRQFDAVLMSVGFKLSPELFAELAGLSAGTVIDTAVRVLAIVRRMTGDHVQHNVYFRDFPRNVPETTEFWMECLIEALLDPVAAAHVGEDLAFGTLNLLALPKYGRYQHNYAEMIDAHQEFVGTAADRVTVLHRGGPLANEVSELYLSLASRPIALNDDDRETLRALATACAADARQPTAIPVRETRALINQVRLEHGADLLVDTVTDVLRLACAWSEGDVTLLEPTRFKNFPRRVRRSLLCGLDRVVADSPSKLGDVNQRAEQWKRLGERLHPHEYPQYAFAAQVFAVARGDVKAPSLASRVEELFSRGEVTAAATLLQSAPGQLLRTLDRLLRSCGTAREQHAVVESVKASMTNASSPVLLSTQTHVINRAKNTGRRRVFVNSRGRGCVVDDIRPVIDPAVLDYLSAMFDDEIRRRMPPISRLVVDPDILAVAIPLTGKATTGGIGVLGRGSVSPIIGQRLRFFTYWKQRAECTDFDLSALLLDADFGNPRWLSYTQLTMDGGVHSGDIVDAPDGATEFIDIDLAGIDAHVIIPEVNVFSGEGFNDVAESFFGFMLRDGEQEGRPFEPRTVRMKSELRGAGRVALPLAFLRGEDDHWRALWLHLHLRGSPMFNQVENNSSTTTDLARTLSQREFITVDYIVGLLNDVQIVELAELGNEPVTYIGLERPDQLPHGSRVFTPENLADLIVG